MPTPPPSPFVPHHHGHHNHGHTHYFNQPKPYDSPYEQFSYPDIFNNIPSDIPKIGKSFPSSTTLLNTVNPIDEMPSIPKPPGSPDPEDNPDTEDRGKSK
jgi:hypothetical protein